MKVLLVQWKNCKNLLLLKDLTRVFLPVRLIARHLLYSRRQLLKPRMLFLSKDLINRYRKIFCFHCNIMKRSFLRALFYLFIFSFAYIGVFFVLHNFSKFFQKMYSKLHYFNFFNSSYWIWILLLLIQAFLALYFDEMRCYR